MAITRLTTFDDLVAFLAENQVPHRADAGKLALEIGVTSPTSTGTVYIRWDKDLPLVQIVYPFITDIPPERLADLEAAVCRANTTIKLPGFGIEYGQYFLYMRLVVQLYDGDISAPAFQRQVLAVLANAREFAGAFRDIIAGSPGKDVLELAVKHNRTSGG